MKPFHSLISTTLLLTIVFTACTNNASDKATTANSDTTAAPVITTDSGQNKLEANKKLVMDFYQSLYGDKDSNAIDKYIADNIIEHNPILQDGKEWLKNTLRPFFENPNIEKTKIDMKHIAADGDMVWVYVKDVAPNGKVFARAEIFRIENGKIAEDWKISEPVPAKSANNNTMF
jgi:predicted SnoaL-like aldol condensation-catalyzing enzyme